MSSTTRAYADHLHLSQSTLRVLQITQRTSALTFSTFLIVHLSAPIWATLAPPFSSKSEVYASRMMILGRVWYQGEWSEGVVVWGSLGVHLLSGMLARFAKSWVRRERKARRREELRRETEEGALVERAEKKLEEHDDDEPTTTDALPPPVPLQGSTILGSFTLHDLTGYALLLPLAHHTLLHRIIPSSGKSPISPSLLSYSFVSYSLSQPSYAALSAAGYAAVVGLGTYHFLSGLRRVSDPTAPRGLGVRRRKGLDGRERVEGRAWRAVWAALVLGVGVGAARLGGEGGTVPEWLGRRYDLVLRRAFQF